MNNTPAPTDLVTVRQPGTRSGYSRMAYGTFLADYQDHLEVVPSDEPEEYPTIPAAEAWVPSVVGGHPVVDDATATWNRDPNAPPGPIWDDHPNATDIPGDASSDTGDDGRASGGQEY